MTQFVPYEETHLVRDKCFCLHAQRAARLLGRLFDGALREVGLTNEQFSLLMSLNRAEAPTMGQVSSVLGADRTTVTAALKVLERRGLASGASDPDDRRIRRYGLTLDGHRVLLRALPIWKGMHGVLEGRLATSDGNADSVREGMGHVADAARWWTAQLDRRPERADAR